MKSYIIEEFFIEFFSFLNILAIIAIFFGILTIIIRNPITSIIFLISLFSTISFYLNLIDLNFIGLSYLIVYIGAISILFLFILMLIDIRISELNNEFKNNNLLLIIITSVFIYLIISPLLPFEYYNSNIFIDLYNICFYIIDSLYNMKLNIFNIVYIMGNSWDGTIIEINHIKSIGTILYTFYNIWLILTSFILLLAMTGAIVITIKKTN
jgi:NADH-ubiquinone oxidoreductase chain 6